MTIDWSKPIEAVNSDGAAWHAQVVHSQIAGTKLVKWTGLLVSREHLFFNNGLPVPGASGDGWSIRNVAIPQRSNVPEHPTPTQYAPELVELMVKTIRILAGCEPCGDNDGERKLIAVARSIVSDLPQEVDPEHDPDLDEALEIERSFKGKDLAGIELDMIYAGIARGRQLQRGEAA